MLNLFQPVLVTTLFEAELKESPNNIRNMYRKYFGELKLLQIADMYAPALTIIQDSPRFILADRDSDSIQPILATFPNESRFMNHT